MSKKNQKNVNDRYQWHFQNFWKHRIPVGSCQKEKCQKKSQNIIHFENYITKMKNRAKKCKRQIPVAFSEFLETSDISRRMSWKNKKKQKQIQNINVFIWILTFKKMYTADTSCIFFIINVRCQ